MLSTVCERLPYRSLKISVGDVERNGRYSVSFYNFHGTMDVGVYEITARKYSNLMHYTGM